MRHMPGQVSKKKTQLATYYNTTPIEHFYTEFSFACNNDGEMV